MREYAQPSRPAFLVERLGVCVGFPPRACAVYLTAQFPPEARPLSNHLPWCDPSRFRCSLNLHRRHLDESQRALVAARIANLPRGSNQHASIEAPSQAEASELLNVSRPSVQRARQVLDHGTPALVQAVDRQYQGRRPTASIEAVSQAEAVDRQYPEGFSAGRRVRASAPMLELCVAGEMPTQVV